MEGLEALLDFLVCTTDALHVLFLHMVPPLIELLAIVGDPYGLNLVPA